MSESSKKIRSQTDELAIRADPGYPRQTTSQGSFCDSPISDRLTVTIGRYFLPKPGRNACGGLMFAVFGIFAIALGLAGFTAEFGQWVRQRRFNEKVMKAIAAFSIVAGFSLIGHTVYSFWPQSTSYKFYQPPLQPLIAPLADVDPQNPRRFFSDNRKCSTEFPGEARHQTLSLSPNVHDVAFIQDDRRETYCVSRADCSTNDSAQRPSLDEFVEAYREHTLAFPIASDGTTRIVMAEELVQDGVAGRRTDFQIGQHYLLLTRLFLFEGDFYSVTLMIREEKQNDPVAKRFFESIRFHPSQPSIGE